ncbi:hypothetical protein SAMN05444166_1138 [Singulisphaera sp. GP187]|uniref:hypothetical protein n=1 Tax=Singulisphaera sp. GP187 TaxID=1882752 RepID=UPI00092B8FDD|nr:hypothetical protein [Singulisphaera sp. GP187]SIN82736.1 hypothetical protein SAMN05444166_1138 [Singulisphaera sp. GP187]
MSPEQRKAAIAGLTTAGLLAVAILVGSRNLKHIDAALVGYTFASLFAAFGVAYRYSMWLQRPPTRMYWRRGWKAFCRPAHLWDTLTDFIKRFTSVFLLNAFIWKRSKPRGLAHMLIMWGCIGSAAITFPLVFGWVHFETVPGDLSRYRTHVFGFGLFDFPHESLFGHLLFHGLVWCSLLVIPGVLMAYQRRIRDHAAAALQNFREDLLPLFLLFAVSITGLLLAVSYTWMKGYAYEFLAILHAVTVIFTLLWLPFGKFFHIFQRPAQLGVKFYRDAGEAGEQAVCVRCASPFATKVHIEDLIAVERELGYKYETANQTGAGIGTGHYQHVCPACRRKMFALAQGQLWKQVSNGG